MSEYLTTCDCVFRYLTSFSLAIVTGYGITTPNTIKGKIVTIVYAIIGMPLFLLYLSNIGDVMAKSFKWIYAKVCLCRICPGVAKRRAYRTRRKIRAMTREYEEDDVILSTSPCSMRRANHENISLAIFRMNICLEANR